MAWPDPSPRRTFRFRILSGSLFFRTDGSLLIGLVNLLARSSPNCHLGSRFWVLSGSVSFHTVSSLLIGLVNLLARSSPDGHLGSSWCTIFDLQTSELRFADVRYRPFGKRGVVAFLVAFFELQRRRHAVPELRRVHVRGIQSRVCEGARGSTQDRNSSFPGGWERASQERPRRSAGREARGSQSPDPWSGPESCFFLINAKKKRHAFRASRRI